MVDSEDILKIARLAKLSIEETEIEQFTKEMSELIRFADAINVFVDDEIEFDDINNIFNVFSDDNVMESFNREDILKNREGGESGMFVVRHVQK